MANRFKDDLDFMVATRAAIEEATPYKSRLLLWSFAAFITAMLVWAYYAEIDELARGEGKVIPSRQLQVVQNLEGGIVSEILVSEGALVQQGQPLLKIDDTLLSSSFQESQLRYLELLAKTARFKAEAEGLSNLEIPEEVIAQSPGMAKQEMELFRSRRVQLEGSLNVISKQIRQREEELLQAKSNLQQTQRRLELAQKEYNILKPLFDNGVVSEVELIRAEREVLNMEGEIASVKSSLPQLTAAIEELTGKSEELVLSFRSEVQSELSEAMAEMSRIAESSGALEDKVSRTIVRSPVKGTVKQILINTVGGVVQPGMDIINIVPVDDALLIETKIRPADIARLYPGQQAKVKFTAYDFTIYGGLDATVVHISADSITDENDESFFLVRVKTDKNYLGNEERALPIIPGMTTQVDILTGKKTVLDYLLKPIFKAKQNALTER